MTMFAGVPASHVRALLYPVDRVTYSTPYTSHIPLLILS